ncbi:hypothetical protein Vretimale_9572 [Volvox reticuliferus]|uniref:Uncharacterized protein n=1 Tax=Volvox reticuliferus TaxID=1737510 RepID=A0A8J4GCZ2_9CHLO|nr:hypothetical protein Vretimale_9572 [Volvox reticuliferus]
MYHRRCNTQPLVDKSCNGGLALLSAQHVGRRAVCQTFSKLSKSLCSGLVAYNMSRLFQAQVPKWLERRALTEAGSSCLSSCIPLANMLCRRSTAARATGRQTCEPDVRDGGQRNKLGAAMGPGINPLESMVHPS